MANFWSKITVPTQLNRWSTADLSCDHITTQDVFKIKPVYCRELMPFQTINLQMDSMVRLDPLTKPFYGRMDLITRFFFVPYRTVFKGWNALITGTPYFSAGTSAILDSVPYFTNLSLRNVLVANSSSVTTDDYDFISSTLNASTSQVVDTKYKLSNRGRYLFDLLRCLGYEVSFRLPTGPDSPGYENGSNSKKMSALPFLCYVKIWKDWYYNSVYAVPNQIESLLNNFNSGGLVSDQLISAGLDFLMMANYDQDIFTAAWDNPVGPSSSSVSSVMNIPDPTITSEGLENRVSTNNSAGLRQTPYIVNKDGASNNIKVLSQYAVDVLKSVTDFVTRRKLVGSKVLDRYLPGTVQNLTIRN